MTSTVLPEAAGLAAATPSSRDRYLDLLRVFSIGVVVLGHWLMLTITVVDGRVQAGNILATVPAARLLTWVFQVMPIFFFVGGAAHAAALKSLRAGGGRYPEFVAARMRRLLAPTGVFLAVWAAIAVGTELAGAQRPGSIATLMTHTVTQPLWFLGVYLGVVGLAPVMYAAHRRWGAAVPAVLLLAAAAVDAARTSYGPIGALNVALVWLAVHQAGFLYSDGRLTRPVGAVLAGAGLVGTVTLTVVTGWYPISMVGLPGAPVSNMNPPTLALVAHACWLIGLLLLARAPITRWLRQRRVWTAVVAANGVVMTVFLWHLTALFALAGIWLVLSGPLPAPGGAGWWLLRPFWVALLVGLLVPLVAAARRFERPARRPASRHRRRPTAVDATGAGTGVGLATLGLLIVPVTGLNGLLAGRTATLVVLPVTGLAGLAALATGWALVRASQR